MTRSEHPAASLAPSVSDFSRSHRPHLVRADQALPQSISKGGVQVHDMDSEEQLKRSRKSESTSDSPVHRQDRAEEFGVELIYEDRLHLHAADGSRFGKKAVVDLKNSQTKSS